MLRTMAPGSNYQPTYWIPEMRTVSHDKKDLITYRARSFRHRRQMYDFFDGNLEPSETIITN